MENGQVDIYFFDGGSYPGPRAIEELHHHRISLISFTMGNKQS
jgi:hypothetical protein